MQPPSARPGCPPLSPLQTAVPSSGRFCDPFLLPGVHSMKLKSPSSYREGEYHCHIHNIRGIVKFSRVG